MNRTLAFAATVLLVAVVGYFAWSGFKVPPVAESAAIVTTPPGWVKLDEGDFSLYGPRGSALRKAKGAGFIYGDVTGSELCVRFQAGAKAELMLTKKSHPDFTEGTLTVDGRPAIVRKAYLGPNEQQYWFPGCGAALYMGLEVPGALADGGTLVVEVSATSEDGLDDAGTMFRSIRFAKAAR